MLRCGRSADETGKTRGGGARVYIINQWCTNVTVREPLCTEHVELLCVALRPFYLPTEFNQLFITVVYAPLLPLTSRSLTTRRATYVTTLCLPSAKTLLLSFLATSASAGSIDSCPTSSSTSPVPRTGNRRPVFVTETSKVPFSHAHSLVWEGTS